MSIFTRFRERRRKKKARERDQGSLFNRRRAAPIAESGLCHMQTKLSVFDRHEGVPLEAGERLRSGAGGAES